jgi:hypothetical protein
METFFPQIPHKIITAYCVTYYDVINRIDFVI